MSRGAKRTCSCRKHGLRCSQISSSYHGDSCTNVDETMVDDITDIGINDDTQDKELIFERMMQIPMQNDAEDDSKDVDENEEDEEPKKEEEEEHATQTHTDGPHTKKRKVLIQ